MPPLSGPQFPLSEVTKAGLGDLGVLSHSKNSPTLFPLLDQSQFQRLPLSPQGPQKCWVPRTQHVPLSVPLCPLQAMQHRQSVLGLSFLICKRGGHTTEEHAHRTTLATPQRWPCPQVPHPSFAASCPLLPPHTHLCTLAPPSHNPALSSVP